MRRDAIALMLGIAVAGCSSKSTDPPASQRCDEVGASICEDNATCGVQTGNVPASDRSAFVANCVTGFKLALDCSRKTQVVGNPDVCETDMARTPCSFYDATNGLPIAASCKSIFR